MRIIGDKDMERGLYVADESTMNRQTQTYMFTTFNSYGYPETASSFVLQYVVNKEMDNNLCAPGAHNADSFCGMVSDGGDEDPYLACNVCHTCSL
jgi:hypothetical protein